MKLNRWKRIGIIASVVWILGAGLITYKVQVDDNVKSADMWWKDCNSTLTDKPGRASECDERKRDHLASTLPSVKYYAAIVALVPVPLAWGFAYLALFIARWFARTRPRNRWIAGGLIAIAGLLIAKASYEPPHPANTIWVGNADIDDETSQDAVSAFEKAFAVEPACHGLTLSLNKMPSKPYWFLETYSANTNEEIEQGAPYRLTWWMDLSEEDESMVARFDSDANRLLPKQAAQDVCLIANQKGGMVR